MPQQEDISSAVKRMFGMGSKKQPAKTQAQQMPVYKPSTPQRKYKRGPGGKMVPDDTPELKKVEPKRVEGKR